MIHCSYIRSEGSSFHIEAELNLWECMVKQKVCSMCVSITAGGTERKIPRRPPRTRLVSLQEARGEAPEPGPDFPDLDADLRRFSVI